jgi:hypothetical protein
VKRRNGVKNQKMESNRDCMNAFLKVISPIPPLPGSPFQVHEHFRRYINGHAPPMGPLHDPGSSLGSLAPVPHNTLGPFWRDDGNCVFRCVRNVLPFDNLGRNTSVGGGSRVHLRGVLSGSLPIPHPLPPDRILDDPVGICSVGVPDYWIHGFEAAWSAFPKERQILI